MSSTQPKKVSDYRAAAKLALEEILATLPRSDFTVPLAKARKMLEGKSSLTPQDIVQRLTAVLSACTLQSEALSDEAWDGLTLDRIAQVEAEIEMHHHALDKLNKELHELENGSNEKQRKQVEAQFAVLLQNLSAGLELAIEKGHAKLTGQTLIGLAAPTDNNVMIMPAGYEMTVLKKNPLQDELDTVKAQLADLKTAQEHMKSAKAAQDAVNFAQKYGMSPKGVSPAVIEDILAIGDQLSETGKEFLKQQLAGGAEDVEPAMSKANELGEKLQKAKTKAEFDAIVVEASEYFSGSTGNVNATWNVDHFDDVEIEVGGETVLETFSVPAGKLKVGEFIKLDAEIKIPVAPGKFICPSCGSKWVHPSGLAKHLMADHAFLAEDVEQHVKSQAKAIMAEKKASLEAKALHEQAAITPSNIDGSLDGQAGPYTEAWKKALQEWEPFELEANPGIVEEYVDSDD